MVYGFFFLSFLGKEWFMFLTQVKIRVSEWGIFVSVKFDQLKTFEGYFIDFPGTRLSCYQAILSCLYFYFIVLLLLQHFFFFLAF